jgi:hypothetical protein
MSGAAAAGTNGQNASGMEAASAMNTPPTAMTDPNGEGADVATPGEGAPVDARRPTMLSLDAATMRVYRGQMLDIAGHLASGANVPVPEGRVEIRVEGGRLLGVALTDAQGRFSISLGIPPDLGIGRHPLEVTFVGKPDLLPSRAQ